MSVTHRDATCRGAKRLDRLATCEPASYRGRTRRQRDPKTGKLFRSLGPVVPITAVPPPPLRALDVRFDNLALVPASLLPRKAQWQALANRLPRGQVLIIVPRLVGSRRSIVSKVADHLRRRGHHGTTLDADQISQAPS